MHRGMCAVCRVARSLSIAKLSAVAVTKAPQQTGGTFNSE